MLWKKRNNIFNTKGDYIKKLVQGGQLYWSQQLLGYFAQCLLNPQRELNFSAASSTLPDFCHIQPGQSTIARTKLFSHNHQIVLLPNWISLIYNSEILILYTCKCTFGTACGIITDELFSQ